MIDDLYERVGGLPFFERLVDEFYRGVVDDEVLWPLYPDQSDLEERGHPRLRMRHMTFTVGPLERDRWLVHMARATETVCLDAEVANEMMGYFTKAAEHLRNDTGLPITAPKR